MTLPCSLLFAPVMCCASTVSSRRAAEERVALTERRAYRTHWEAIDAGTTMPGSGRSTSGSFSGERSISSG